MFISSLMHCWSEVMHHPLAIYPILIFHNLHHLLTSSVCSDRSAKLPARSCQEKRAEEETVRQRYFQRTHAISKEAHWRPDFVHPVLREDESQQVSFELVRNSFYFIWIQLYVRNRLKELIKLNINIQYNLPVLTIQLIST